MPCARLSLVLVFSTVAASAQAQSSATLQFLRKIQVDPSGTAGSVDGCELSRDGTLLVAGDLHAEARLYRVSDGAFLRKVTHQGGLSGTAGELNAIGFSTDDQHFVTGIDAFGAKIWRTSDGAFIRHLASGKTADGAGFSADGKWFATGANNVAEVYALPGFGRVATITHAAGAEVNSLEFSMDSTLLVTAGGTGDEKIKIIRTSDWAVLRTMTFGASTKSVRFSNDRTLVAAGGRNQLAKVYRVSDGVQVAHLVHQGNLTPLAGDDLDRNPAIEAVAWSQDGNYLFTSGVIDGVMRAWRVADWSLIDHAQAQSTNRGIEYIDVSNTNMVAVGGDEGSVYLFQFNPPALKTPFKQDSGADGLVSIEIENHDTNLAQGGHRWVSLRDGAASGGTKLRAQPNSGANKDTGYQTYDPKKDSPKLDFRIELSKSGIHHVWARGKGGGADNSIHVGLGGKPLDSADRLQFGSSGSSSWTWVKQTEDGPPATIDIPAPGTYTVNVWMREDGTDLDKLVITTNPSYTPTGAGPAQSPRSPAGGGHEPRVPLRQIRR